MALSVIVSGGGICGLATATAFAQRGWKATVFESRPTLRVTGSGIYMHNNSLDALAHLGAYERAAQNPFRGKGFVQLDNEGKMIISSDWPEEARVFAIPRSDLLAGLEQAARAAGVEIVTGAEVIDARADGTLIFPNGDRINADLAIGADGLWSAVRRSLGLELSAARSPEGGLRTIIKGTQDDIPEEMRGRFIEHWNGKLRVLVTPINEAEIYLALTCPEADAEARDTRIRPVWTEKFPRWKHLFDRVDAEVLWGVYTVMKCKSWSAGRTCIVGDAAHATTPNLGSGAGLAMTNGMALAAYMANVDDPRDIPEALAVWEARVRPQTEHIQHWSSMFGEIANVPNEARPGIVNGALSNAWVREQMAKVDESTLITQVDWTPNSGAA